MSIHGEPVPLQPADTTKLPTSFVAQTAEVESMRKELADGNPIFWYELAQNAADYNDNTKGSPAIRCFPKGGIPLSLTSYLQQGASVPLQRIEFANKIKGNSGMTPDDVAHIAHGGGQGTLGVHGRGLTVTSTLAVADKLCAGIEYVSKDAHGAWVGRGIMESTRADQKDPHFVLEYKRNGFDTDETIVRVVEPSATLVDTLTQLPTHFLPVNPHYQFARFEGSEVVARVPNLLTVAARPGITDAVFSEEELRKMQLPPDEANEPRRAEILPDELVQRNLEQPLTYMYVDGLQLRYDRRSSGSPALVWSFYGFGKTGEHAQYLRIARSKDSAAVEASDGPTHVMGFALKKCAVPEVHKRILIRSLGTSRCLEGSIDVDTFENGVSVDVQQAIASGWRQMLQERQLDPDTLITSNNSMVERARAEGRAVIQLSSEAYVQALKKYGNVKTVEDTFQVTKRAEYSGENMQIRVRDSEEHLRIAVTDSLRMIARHHGRVQVAEQGGVRVEFDFIPSFGDVETFSDMAGSPLLSAATNLVGAIPEDTSTCRVSIDTGKKIVFFEVRKHERYTATAKFDLTVYSGEAVSSGSPRILLEVVPKEPDNGTVRAYADSLQTEVAKYTVDGVFDIQKYFASSPDDVGSLEDMLRERKAELEKLEGEARARRRAISRLSRNKPTSEFDTEVDTSLNIPITELPKEVGRAVLKTWLRPDATFTGGPLFGEVYFRDGIMSTRSARRVDLPAGKKRAERTLTMPKGEAGFQPILCPVGYVPVGYEAEGVQATFYQDEHGHGWGMQLDRAHNRDIKIFYNQAMNRRGRAEPSDTKNLIQSSDLSAEWSGIVTELLHDTQLSEKQKLAVLAKAWMHTFTYTGRVSYRGDMADQINIAKGDCLNCSDGFVALARAAGIPARLVGGVTGRMGRLVEDPGHAWVEVQLYDEWLDFEPQSGKFLEKVKLPPVPKAYEKLISRLPESKLTFAAVKEAVRSGSPLAVVGVPAVGAAAYLGDSLLVEAARYVSATPLAAQVVAFANQAGTMIASELATHPDILRATAAAAVAGALYKGTRAVYRSGKEAGERVGIAEERQRVEAEIERILQEDQGPQQNKEEVVDDNL